MCDFNAFVGNTVIFHKVKAFVILLQGGIFGSSHTFYLIILLLSRQNSTQFENEISPKCSVLLICFPFSSLCYSGILPYFEMCNVSPWRQQMVWLVCLLVKDFSWEMASRAEWDGGPALREHRLSSYCISTTFYKLLFINMGKKSLQKWKGFGTFLSFFFLSLYEKIIHLETIYLLYIHVFLTECFTRGPADPLGRTWFQRCFYPSLWSGFQLWKSGNVDS